MKVFFLSMATLLLLFVGIAAYKDSSDRDYLAIQQQYQKDYPGSTFDVKVQQIFPAFSEAQRGDTFRVERCISCHVPDIGTIGPEQAAQRLSEDFFKYDPNAQQIAQANGYRSTPGSPQHPAYVVEGSGACTPQPSTKSDPAPAPSCPQATAASATGSGTVPAMGYVTYGSTGDGYPGSTGAAGAGASSGAGTQGSGGASGSGSTGSAGSTQGSTGGSAGPGTGSNASGSGQGTASGTGTATSSPNPTSGTGSSAAPDCSNTNGAGSPGDINPATNTRFPVILCGPLPSFLDPTLPQWNNGSAPTDPTKSKIGIDQIGCIVCHNGNRLGLTEQEAHGCSQNPTTPAITCNLIANPEFDWSQGAALYYKNCVSCHGSLGQGVCVPAQAGQACVSGPPLNNQDRLGFFNEDYYYRCIEYGKTGFEHWGSAMPNWGSIASDFSSDPNYDTDKSAANPTRILSEQQVSVLIQFIRHWENYDTLP